MRACPVAVREVVRVEHGVNDSLSGEGKRDPGRRSARDLDFDIFQAMLIFQWFPDLRLAVDLREIKEMIDHVDQVETAFLYLFDKRPVQGCCSFEKVDTSEYTICASRISKCPKSSMR